MGFFDELQRRKVVRTTIAYLAAAFVIAQATQLLVDGLDLSATLLKVVIILLIVALPVVIGLSWAFDMPPSFKLRRALIPGGVLLGVFAAIGAFMLLRDSSAKELDANLVAVLPFRVSGTPDISYLREGMVDLLAAKLTGQGGPRAADPRAVISAWKRATKSGDDLTADASANIARALGAGQLLLGSIVGTSKELTISATLIDVQNDKRIAAEIQGSADTLTALIDHLAAELMSLSAGEQSRLAALTSTSLSALREYLAGRASYRNSRFADAVRHFSRALAHDSTFALAAMGHILSTGWGELPAENDGHSQRILLANLDRLSSADRAMAVAMIGDRLPDRRTTKAQLAAWDDAVSVANDRADAWFLFGDMHLHYAPLVDMPDHMDVAERAFNRALALDSSMTPALLHLIDISIIRKDTATVRRLEPLRRARDAGTHATYQVPFRLRALGDSAGLHALRASMDTAPLSTLSYQVLVPVFTSSGVDDAIAAADIWIRRATSKDERQLAYTAARDAYVNMGLPSKAAGVLELIARKVGDHFTARTGIVIDALYADGDTTHLAAAIADLKKWSLQNDPRSAGASCVLAQWQILRDNNTEVRYAQQQLREIADSSIVKDSARACDLLLDMLVAHAQKSPAARQKANALDSYIGEGPRMDERFSNVTNFLLSGVYRDLGDDKAALRAITRRMWLPAGFYLTAIMSREEARLRAKTGDHERAIQLYKHYLDMHARAEPRIKAQDDAVRRELAQLIAETR